jgi:hypothetical protein
MRYRVELDGLLAFVDKLQAFEQRADAIAAQVDDRSGCTSRGTGTEPRAISRSTTTG